MMHRSILKLLYDHAVLVPCHVAPRHVTLPVSFVVGYGLQHLLSWITRLFKQMTHPHSCSRLN